MVRTFTHKTSSPELPPDDAGDPPSLPDAAPQETPQLTTPLETAIANARAFEVLVGKMTQELNEARVKLLKWQGAAEFQASLEHPAGPGNGQDTTANPLDPPDGDGKESGT